jgi:hypothetical protein
LHIVVVTVVCRSHVINRVQLTSAAAPPPPAAAAVAATAAAACCLLPPLLLLLASGLVLNALLSRSWDRELVSVLQRRCVASNHFDVDSFLSVWCYINRQATVEHEAGASQ